LTTYGQQTLSNLRAENDYYTPKQIAEIYHVSHQTVCLWCRTGILKADKRESISEKAKGGKHRWRIHPQSIEDIESHKEELIEASKKYWIRLLVKMRK
jgi:hypothetical protein